MVTTEEAWAPSHYYARYDISSKGRVRNKKTGRILKNYTCKKGYVRVHLTDCFTERPCIVARLVMLTFCPRLFKPEYIVRYRDGNRLNCSLDNLYFETQSGKFKSMWAEGMYAARNHPGFPRGALNPRCKALARMDVK